MKIKQFPIKNLIPESLHKVWWIVAPLDYMTSLARQKGDFFKAAISFSHLDFARKINSTPSKNIKYNLSMKNLLPNPNSPKFWQTIQFLIAPLNYLGIGYREFGDLFVSSLFFKTIFVSNSQALQQIFENEHKQFIAPGDGLAKPLIGDYGLTVLSGEAHQHHRQLLIPPFHGNRISLSSKLICKLTRQFMDRLPTGKSFIAHHVMQNISLEIILQVVFGVARQERYQLLKQHIIAILNIFNSPISASFLFFKSLRQDFGTWSPWGRFLRQREAIDNLLYAEIAERRASDNSNRTDILSLLIDARDKNGESLTDRELRDELMTMLVAGHETTAIAMTWALYWTHYLPEVGEKLIAQLNNLGLNPDPADIMKLPYLSAVCNETLRIYPVAIATLPRKVREPVELLGYELPVGRPLVGAIYLLHQREDIYPEPKQFKPERFLERQFSPYEFMPFGGGTRRCIGSALAMTELKLVLATILSNYQLELVDKRPVKPQRRALLLAPAGGVKMIMRGKRIK